jgi:DNA-binding response OmpR family regulator
LVSVIIRRFPSREFHGMGFRPARIGRLHILTVEDDPGTTQSLASLLRREGHEVNTTPDGPAALCQAQARTPDVVLLDIGLPGMNGYDLARHFCQHQGEKRPLLIAVTGHGQEKDRQQAAEAGIDLHVLRPVAPRQLTEVLRRFERVILPMPPERN